jgi:hypothetical protein
MARIELIGVPFDGYGRPGNQARASAVLREAGIAEAFTGHDVHDGAGGCTSTSTCSTPWSSPPSARPTSPTIPAG